MIANFRAINPSPEKLFTFTIQLTLDDSQDDNSSQTGGSVYFYFYDGVYPGIFPENYES